MSAISPANFTIPTTTSGLACQERPNGTICPTDGTATLETPPLEPGFWRISPNEAVIQACAGGSEFDKNGDSYCTKGHAGPLCATCARTFYFDPDDQACLQCNSGNAPMTPL